MTLESKENYPRHTKIVQNSLGFMPEVKPLHKPRGDLVLCALYTLVWQNYARRGRALAAISGKVPRVSDLCFY